MLLSVALTNISAFSGAYLGVYLEDLSEDDKKSLRIKSGVRVELVGSGSPAEVAGIKADDIILRIDNEVINSQDQVKNIITQKDPGNRVRLHLLSEGRRRSVSIRLGKRSRFNLPDLVIKDSGTGQIGFKLQNLTEQLKPYFQVKNGVLIAEITPNSPAAIAGLKAGDVIISADDKSVDSVNELRSVIEGKKTGETLTIGFVRKGGVSIAKLEITETDNILGIDLNNEIIFLGRGREIDLSGISNLFHSAVSDSIKLEFEKQIEKLQEEINQIREKLSR